LREAPPKTNTAANITPKPVVHVIPDKLAADGAVVLIVRVVSPLPVTDGGLKLHEALLGSPAHEAAVKFTVPVYAACPVMLMVRVPEDPWATVRVGALELIAKSDATFTVTAFDVPPR